MFDKIRQWMEYRKRCTAKNLLQCLAFQAPWVINPHFVQVGEHIFLDTGEDQIEMYKTVYGDKPFEDSLEAIENHIHLTEEVPLRYRNEVKMICIAIAQNMLTCLKQQFPDKEFVVLLELKYEESVVLRYQQIREGRFWYIDPRTDPEIFENGLFMKFTSIPME